MSKPRIVEKIEKLQIEIKEADELATFRFKDTDGEGRHIGIRPDGISFYDVCNGRLSFKDIPRFIDWLTEMMK